MSPSATAETATITASAAGAVIVAPIATPAVAAAAISSATNSTSLYLGERVQWSKRWERGGRTLESVYPLKQLDEKQRKKRRRKNTFTPQ